MDAPNNNSNGQKPSHGLRLIRGGASQHGTPTAPSNQATTLQKVESTPTKLTVVTPAKPKRTNPLLMQLNALADAIDNDVKQLLNL